MIVDRRPSKAMRGVALVEAVKGLIVIAAGFGTLHLLHRDARQVAISLVTRLHVDPDGREARLFLKAADHLTDARLWLVAGVAMAYAAVRLAEGLGLWFGRRWASWLGLVGGGLYVPVDIFESIRHPAIEGFVVLALNVSLVIYPALQLRRKTAAFR